MFFFTIWKFIIKVFFDVFTYFFGNADVNIFNFHTIYELEGDIQDLSKVKNSELLDKKVVKRSTEATLVLNKEMSVSEELAEYLEYILELPKSKISSIIGTFNDYSKTATVE